MTVEEQLNGVREAFLKALDDLWKDVPDLAALDSPRAKGIAEHHKDYTEQHKAMFLNEVASLGVLFRHTFEEETLHARKSARVYAEVTSGAPPAECECPQPVPPAPPRPPPTPEVPRTPIAGFTVGSLKGRPQPEGDPQ